jgi:hypothetical protein
LRDAKHKAASFQSPPNLLLEFAGSTRKAIAMEGTAQTFEDSTHPKRDSEMRRRRISFATMLVCVYATFPPGGDLFEEESRPGPTGKPVIAKAPPPPIVSNS